MAKQRKAASKKVAPAKAGKKSSSSQTRNISFASTDTFEVREGIPRIYRKASPEEEMKIVNTLAKLRTGKNHAAIPSKYRSAIKRIASQNFPAFKLRTSYNKHNAIISVWWEK